MEGMPSGYQAKVDLKNEWSESQVHFNLPQGLMKGDEAENPPYTEVHFNLPQGLMMGDEAKKPYTEVQVNLPDDCSSHKSDRDNTMISREEDLEHVGDLVDAEFGEVPDQQARCEEYDN